MDAALAQPDAQALKAFLSLLEDRWFDRKSGRVAAKDLARPLTAFANAEGGTLVVGLHGDRIDGVTPQAENAIRQSSIGFTVPPVRAHTSSRVIDGKTLLIIRVEPGETIHTTRSGDCYLQIGDESRKLSLAEQQELADDRSAQTFESTPVELDPTELDEGRWIPAVAPSAHPASPRC